MAEKILYFNPYSGILEHLKIERDLQRIIKNSDMRLDIVRCDGMYNSYCNVMAAVGLMPDSDQKARDEVCKNCRNLDKFSRNNRTSTYFLLDRFLTNEIEIDVKAVMSGIHIDNWKDFVFQGEFFGRIASYEFFLRNKISDANISESLWPELRNEISMCLKTYFIALSILKDSSYRSVGVYNYLYGVNRAFILAAQQLGKKTFSVQGNGFLYNMHSRYFIYDTDGSYWYLNSSPEWILAKEKPLSFFEIFRVFRHFKSLYAAKSVWTYSSPKGVFEPKEIRKKIGIPPDRNVSLLVTSSADEQFAFNFVGLSNSLKEMNPTLFQSNLEWIITTIDFYKTNPDQYLVIRVHPREFANKREGVNSKEGSRILDFLQGFDLPKNVYLNHPKDQISLYDLARITELLINSTSSVGLEFAALGIPSISVSPSSLVAYPRELSTMVTSKNHYREILSKGSKLVNLPNVSLAFRWINFKHGLCSTRIPRRMSFMDRFYFGPYMRFVLDFPRGKKSTLAFLNIVYLIFESFDGRIFSFYTDQYKGRLRTKSNPSENFAEKTFIRRLK
jgi:hypothetical protein